MLDGLSTALLQVPYFVEHLPLNVLNIPRHSPQCFENSSSDGGTFNNWMFTSSPTLGSIFEAECSKNYRRPKVECSNLVNNSNTAPPVVVTTDKPLHIFLNNLHIYTHSS